MVIRLHARIAIHMMDMVIEKGYRFIFFHEIIRFSQYNFIEKIISFIYTLVQQKKTLEERYQHMRKFCCAIKKQHSILHTEVFNTHYAY